MGGERLLVTMCGLSFSGKSTLAVALASRLNATVISLDGINAERGLYGGYGISGEEWQKTHEIAKQRAHEHLSLGRTVIIDDTGSPRFVRDQWRAVAASAGAVFRIVWVDIDPELQQARLLANRETSFRHDVTDIVMWEQRATFEPPLGEGAIRIDASDHIDDVIGRVIAAFLGPVTQ